MGLSDGTGLAESDWGEFFSCILKKVKFYMLLV